jgi:hypothetical protein
MALFADSNSSAFIYSDNGNFDITSDTKARIEASTFGLGTLRFRVDNSGSAYVTNKMYVGGTVVPTALIHLKAGTATANTAPLKFASGSLLTSPEAGAVEFNGDNLYLTITSSTARKNILLADNGLTFGQIPFTTGSGRLAGSSALTYTASNSTLNMSFNQSARTAMIVTNNSTNPAGEAGFSGVTTAGTAFFGMGSSASSKSAGILIYTNESVPVSFWNNNTRAMTINTSQQLGIGVSNATANLHIKAGTATANTAPLKFNSGTLLGTAEAGAIEFLTDKYYASITTGPSRKEIALSEGLTSGRVPFATTNGRLTDNANLTYNTTNLMLMSGSFMTSPTSGVTASISVFGSGTVGGSTYLDFMRVTNASSGAGTPAKTFRVDNSGSLEIVNNAYNQVLLSLTDNGNLSVNGTTAATVVSNDATSGSLRFNNNNSQIYDDGNFHIHSRGTGQSLWINANSGSIIIGNQSPVSGGAAATAITMGSSTTATAYVSMYGSKTYTIGSYGYVFAGGAGGPLSGTTAPYTLYCDNRIQCSELDATSDERLKDIQGEIPLQEAIDLVNNVKPIKFTWKDGEDKGLKTGFSAQQTHKAGFDHLVGAIKNEKVKEEIDEDGFVSPDQVQLTIAYDQVIPYHTAVIKHLLEKIEKLEQTVAELQAKNK